VETIALGLGEAPPLPADGRCIRCQITGSDDPWSIRLAVGATALSRIADSSLASADAGSSMAGALARVPLGVVAELGRVTLKLSEVLGLRRGDTLRLPAAANDPVLVRVEGVVKFQAVPVISRGQVAVKIQSRFAE
jgi:flagellar motor switch/type III secretory pathway protein FliN